MEGDKKIQSNAKADAKADDHDHHCEGEPEEDIHPGDDFQKTDPDAAYEMTMLKL